MPARSLADIRFWMLDQISLPVRIALIGALAVLAVWFVALRPSGGETPAASAPPAPAPAPSSTPADAVSKAQEAVATASQDAARAESTGSEAPAAPPATQASAPQAPAAAPADPGAAAEIAKLGPVQTALAKGEVVVLLFHNPKAYDDRAMKASVRRLDGKGVAAVVTTPDHISRYGRVTRTVKVLTTPSVVIVDRQRQASVIAGFADDAVLEQAVADARRARPSA